MGERCGLIDHDAWEFVWVVDAPMFEQIDLDGGATGWTAIHHPFTAPTDEYAADFHERPGEALSKAYDIVLNGSEIGGGSIRIHRSEMQERVFDVIGLSREEAQSQFGFLLEAFAYGPPPHGGIALGIDRLCALLAGADSIRDVIAFPKTASGGDPLTGAPSPITAAQRAEAGVDAEPRRLTPIAGRPRIRWHVSPLGHDGTRLVTAAVLQAFTRRRCARRRSPRAMATDPVVYAGPDRRKSLLHVDRAAEDCLSRHALAKNGLRDWPVGVPRSLPTVALFATSVGLESRRLTRPSTRGKVTMTVTELETVGSGEPEETPRDASGKKIVGKSPTRIAWERLRSRQSRRRLRDHRALPRPARHLRPAHLQALGHQP